MDYNLGTVKIINQAILNAGLPVNVQFENNAGFGIQHRNFMGLRLDYMAKQTAREQLSNRGHAGAPGRTTFLYQNRLQRRPYPQYHVRG